MNDAELIEQLRLRHARGERLKSLYFWGHQATPGRVTAACFSQWFEAPFEVDGDRFLTAEHFMMARKAALFGDEATRAAVLRSPSPGAAKALGRQVAGFDETVWTRHRFAIVVEGNAAKFAQHPALAEFLRQTGQRVLVEASPVDRIWGVGLAADDPAIEDPHLWQGLNLLGFALMRVREDLAPATG